MYISINHLNCFYSYILYDFKEEENNRRRTRPAPANDEDEIFRLSKHLDHIYIRIHSIFAGVDFKPDPLKLSKPRTERLGDQESVDYMNISKLL